MNPRLKELLDRMVAPGQFPNMSASEGHELVELVRELHVKYMAREVIILDAIEQLEPLARQIIDPRDNVFRRIVNNLKDAI
jgi:nitrogen-specific signal transduction histidine kinase